MRLSRLMYAIAVFSFLTVQVVAQYSVSLPYRDVSVTMDNGVASFKGAPLTGEPGQPFLPVYTVTFLLPSDADFNNVIVTLENQTEKELEGMFDVKPALPTIIDNKPVWPNGRKIIDGKDIGIYNRNEFYPADFKGKVQFGAMRDYKLVEIAVYPFRYNPVSRKLRMITGGTITLTVPGSGKITKRVPSSRHPESEVEKWIKNNVANPQTLQDYGIQSEMNLLQAPATSISGETYAIITTNAIVNGSTQFSNLVALKQQKGFNVITVTENVWGGGTGDVAANNIRTWLKNNYASQNIHYVLLIGNPNPTTGDVPMKMCWPRSTLPSDREAPSDFFYAELSGNWDINNDGLSGEYADFIIPGGPDQYAEVAVGRIPTYNSDITKLDKIIQKIIHYENQTNIEWRRFVLLPMEPLGSGFPGCEVGERIKTNSLEPKMLKSFRLYDHFSVSAQKILNEVVELNPPAESPECSEPRVLNVWKNNKFGLVAWSTHGNSDYAAGVLSSSSTEYLDDQHPSIVCQASCLNAYPESSTNLAYSLLANGAIATIAATRVSWGFPVEDPTSCSGIISAFVQNVVRDSMEVAPALNLLKSNSQVYGSDNWMNWLIFNVYGCPDQALNLKPSVIAAPTNLNATAISSSQVNLSWTDNSTDETGFRIERAPYNGYFTQIATVGPNVTSYQNTGLSTGMQYQFRVSALKSADTSLPSNVASTFTLGSIIDPPAGVLVQSTENDQLRVSWNPVTGATSYTVWISTTNGGPYVIARSELSGTSCEFKLTSGERFYFVVTAVTPNGESPYSAQVNAIAPLMTPANLTATAISSEIQLYWPYSILSSQLDGVTFEIEYATNDTFTLLTTYDRALSGNIHDVTGLTPGIIYQFRIRAKKGIYYSEYSNIATAIITTYEAEGATLSGSAKVNTNHTGYSGAGFVDGFYNSTTAQVLFHVNAEIFGNYEIALHYSAGNGTNTNTGLYVNGVKIKNINCPATANWNTWADKLDTVALSAGDNTIEYKAESSSSSCINLDYIVLTYKGEATYTINATAGANGSISPSGSVIVNIGNSPTFTISPSSGYQIDMVTVDGTNLGAITSYTFNYVSANHTISATFKSSTGFPDPTKWYKIATRSNTNQCLDVTGGNYANGTAIELWQKANVNQEFQFKDAGSGYYTITCRGNTNYSIDMSGNFANGQTLKLWNTQTYNPNQKFKLVLITGGYYRIESSNSGYSIDNTGNTANGVRPYLWASDNNNVNQHWVVTVVP